MLFSFGCLSIISSREGNFNFADFEKENKKQNKDEVLIVYENGCLCGGVGHDGAERPKRAQPRNQGSSTYGCLTAGRITALRACRCGAWISTRGGLLRSAKLLLFSELVSSGLVFSASLVAVRAIPCKKKRWASAPKACTLLRPNQHVYTSSEKGKQQWHTTR